MQSYRTHLKETYKLAYPIAIAQLGHIMLGVTDSIMVGRVGAVSLAASSLVNSLFFLILIFGIGMTVAITPLVAIAVGRNQKDQAGVILRQALFVNIFVTLVLFAILYLLANLLVYFKQDKEVVVQAISYAKIISFSVIPFMIFQTYRQFIEGLSFTKPAMYIAIIANVVNIFGNWVFIYGNLGVPSYGLDGAGYSTLLTRSFMAICFVAYVLSSKKFKEYDPSFKFKNINIPVIKRLVGVGVPTGIQNMMEVSAFSFSTIMVGWFGSAQLAAHQVAMSLASITFMVVLGISLAGSIRVGNAYGRSSTSDVRRAGYLTTILSSALMAVFAVFIIVFNDTLPLLFISDPEVVLIASSLLVVAALFQVSDGAQASGLGILRGITDVKIPMVLTFIAYWVIGLPLSYLLSVIYKMNAVGVWVGLLAGLSVSAVLLNVRFGYKTKNLDFTK